MCFINYKSLFVMNCSISQPLSFVTIYGPECEEGGDSYVGLRDARHVIENVYQEQPYYEEGRINVNLLSRLVYEMARDNGECPTVDLEWYRDHLDYSASKCPLEDYAPDHQNYSEEHIAACAIATGSFDVVDDLIDSAIEEGHVPVGSRFILVFEGERGQASANISVEADEKGAYYQMAMLHTNPWGDHSLRVLKNDNPTNFKSLCAFQLGLYEGDWEKVSVIPLVASEGESMGSI